MNSRIASPLTSVIGSFLAFAVVSVSGHSNAQAVTPVTPRLDLERGYVFAPLAGSPATAGYGVLTNISKETLTIVGVNSESFKAIELHETKEENGLMKMKRLPKLTLKPQQKFELKPGGNHLMLFEANPLVKQGDRVTLVFQIEDKTGKPTIQSPVDVPVKARP